MRKYIFVSSLILSSFSAFAGGGGSSWQPSVGPGQCLAFLTDTGTIGGYAWRDTSECNEVISRGFAQGVFVSGKVVYAGGQDVFGYSGIVSPNNKFIIDAPDSYNGNSKIGLADGFTQWFK